MPYLLEDLVIDRVDLVDEGANSAAFIELYKRKEHKESMNYEEVIAKMKPEHAALIQAEIDRLSGEVAKSQEDLTLVTTELDEAVLKLAEADTKEIEEDTNDEEDILKAMPAEAREVFTKMKAQKDAAEEELRKAKESEKEAEAVSKAAELQSLPIEQDKLVGIVKSATPEVLELLKTVASTMEETTLGEIGKSTAGAGVVTDSNDAWSKIEAKADDIVKSTKISKAKAVTQVVNENPELYKQYLQGGAN